MHVLRQRIRWAALTSVAATLVLVLRPSAAPALVLVGLLCAFPSLVRAWRSASGTALRPAILWAGVAVVLAAISQVVALAEPFSEGRPGAGQFVYLSTLAAFATLMSVLNARTPGTGAWAILMAMLVVIFLVPWLEGSGLVREGNGWDRLRLSPPWTIFYALIVLAGVTNYLPTRFGLAALVVAVGFFAEYLGLTRVNWSREVRGVIWTVVPLTWATAIWLADLVTTRHTPQRTSLDRLWAWFRDAWGVVWALRVLERFNRAAEAARWPFRLSWHGVAPLPGSEGVAPEIPPSAAATLAGLLRRFASSERLEAVMRGQIGEAATATPSGPLVGSDALD
jgi:hypothetical protein